MYGNELFFILVTSLLALYPVDGFFLKVQKLQTNRTVLKLPNATIDAPLFNTSIKHDDQQLSKNEGDNLLPIYEIDHEDKILNGKLVKTRKYPYMVSLFQRFSDNRIGHMCGGAILNTKWILTAAHCFNSIKHFAEVILYINAGTLDWWSGESGSQMIPVENYFQPNSFDKFEYINDIALIKLKGHLKITKLVQEIALPSKTDPLPIGKAIIIGWGKIDIQEEISSDTLREANTSVSSISDCMNYFRSPLDQITQLCVGIDEISNSCSGDSGGPLIQYKNDGSPVLIGVMSFGTLGCHPDAPSVYTNVAAYLDWISETITSNTN